MAYTRYSIYAVARKNAPERTVSMGNTPEIFLGRANRSSCPSPPPYHTVAPQSIIACCQLSRSLLADHCTNYVVCSVSREFKGALTSLIYRAVVSVSTSPAWDQFSANSRQ